jgi:hypothetical protein
MDEDELRYRAEVPCYCGKQGCIETFISGTGFATDYQRLSGHSLKGSEIMQRVGERDPVAELALSRYEMRLAKSLAHVVNILDPDVIVLGGGMSNVDRLYQTVPNLVKPWVFGGSARRRFAKPRTGTPAACAARPGCGRCNHQSAARPERRSGYPRITGPGSPPGCSKSTAPFFTLLNIQVRSPGFARHAQYSVAAANDTVSDRIEIFLANRIANFR